MDYFDILFAKTNGVSASTCYNEIESMLKSTVGHSSKNLLDLTKYSASTNVTDIVIDSETGSVSANASGTFKSIYFVDENIHFENGKTYVVSCTNNSIISQGRLAIRKRGTNTVFASKSLSTIGEKSITFTPNEVDFPDGWTITLFITGSSGSEGTLDVSGLMLKEVSISDNTFEPYVTPTDEKKQDKPVELDSTVLTFNIAEIQSKYETLKFVVEYTRDEITTIEYNVVEVPTFIFSRGDTSYYKIFTFSAGYARDNFDAISFTESDGNVTVNPYTASSQNIIKIIGTPK